MTTEALRKALDRSAFHAWLAALPPNHPVGRPPGEYWHCNCPIALYLRACFPTAHKAQVTSGIIYLIPEECGPQVQVLTPAWAANFISLVDSRVIVDKVPALTREELLAFLADASDNKGEDDGL